MRGRRAARIMVAGIAIAAMLMAATATAQAGTTRKGKPGAHVARLAAVYGVSGRRVLSVSGFARNARKGYRVTLQTRRNGRTHARRAGRVGGGGRFSLRWRYPRGTSSLKVRVRVTRKKGRRKLVAQGAWKTIRVSGLKRGRKRARIKASDILSLPPADTGGSLVVKGRPRVRSGQVVGLGVTRTTPGGVLQKITKVTRAGSRTVLTTEPASLPEVIPAGSLDVQLPQTTGAEASAVSTTRKSAPATCSAGQSMSATADVGLSAGTALEGSWGVRGLKASFTGTASASASVRADISGAASCDLRPVGVFPRGLDLGTYRFTISGFPVVLQPTGQIYLSGHADAQAKISTSASASVTATAGVRYERGRFTPFGGMTPQTSFTPPSLSASGFAGLYASPAVFVKVNGIGGPELDLKSGLELSADINRTPWWTLSAPLSAGVKFKIDVLGVNKESPRFEVYKTSRQLATAGGPFPRPPAPPQPQSPITRARLDWDTATDVDLHVWDDEGRETYFAQQYEIPSAQLVEDIIPGYGPEFFQENGSFGRRYTYGICQYSGDGANVALTITDPNGQQRRVTGSLGYRKDSEILDYGSDGGGYRPPDSSWCDDGDDDIE